MKTGYKTTEFYITLASSVMGLLVTYGILSPDDVSTISEVFTKMVGGAITTLPAISYIVSRGIAKKPTVVTQAPAQIPTYTQQPVQMVPVPVQPQNTAVQAPPPPQDQDLFAPFYQEVTPPPAGFAGVPTDQRPSSISST